MEIQPGEYEGRRQFVVRTEAATYWYDQAAGGIARLVDRDGNDWIGFRKDPLQQFPASAAAGYRGIPNLVYGAQNPDAGVGHPGFDKCRSRLIEPDVIETESISGRWRWRWKFTDQAATLTVLQADPGHAYWFLYEGPVGGHWSPPTHFWGTDSDGLSREQPGLRSQRFGQWQWAYFGDTRQPRVLLVQQIEPDELADTLWYLGSEPQGLASRDGMIVFGFGRGPGTAPLLRRTPLSFRIGLVETGGAVADDRLHQQLVAVAQRWLEEDTRR